MTSDEEVGLVDSGVAAPAEVGGVGGAVERRFSAAELANPRLLLHLSLKPQNQRETLKPLAETGGGFVEGEGGFDRERERLSGV